MILMLSLLASGCAFITEEDLAGRLDADGDGVSWSDDCDDDDAALATPGTWYADGDGDGYGAGAATEGCARPEGFVATADDCDDLAPAVHPDAGEVCDGVDDDCDGAVDDDDPDLVGATSWHPDEDGDEFGDPAVTVEACGAPAGHVADATDCDDGDARFHPGAVESDCGDPLDYNCDGSTGADDADRDGSPACQDCDDADAERSPDATERCDEVDNDCDGATDEDDAADAASWHADADGDGYGDPDATAAACSAPEGYVSDATDCDDARSGVSPAGVEVCDADDTDEDCDGAADDASATGGTTWFADVDGDSYGDATAATIACDAPSSHVLDATDCDDGDAGVSPAAAEVCGGEDEDCDGLTDDDDASVTGRSTWYADGDADGYGGTTVASACDAPSGYVAAAGDCDDATASVSPAGTETCLTAADDDCDGSANDLGASGCTPWYLDADRDGHGDSTTQCTCVGAGSYTAADDEDCDDSDASVSPDEAEVCGDGVDNDCDGGAGSCGITGTVALSTADARIEGHAFADQLGYGVGAVEDLTGDGLPDLLIGTPFLAGSGSNSGGVYLVAGSTRGTVDVVSVDTALRYGEAASDQVGYAIASGDFDADGTPDLLLGAYANDRGGTTAGAAFIVEGPVTGSSSLSGATAILTGESAGDEAGYTVANAGLADGDFREEPLIGAPHDDDGGADAGAVYMFTRAMSGASSLATADGKLMGESAGDKLGYGLAGAFDFDGDGFDDTIVGAPLEDSGGSSAGSAYVVSGTFYGILFVDSAAEAVLRGEAAGDNAGIDVSGLGDFDGDGRDDIVVGASGGDRAYVVRGGTSGTVSLSSATLRMDSTGLGERCVQQAGDIDADGLVDVLVGAPFVGNGTTYLVLGGASGTILLSTGADAVLTGETGGDYAGMGATGVGDVDGDGFGDLLLGAYGYDGGAEASGAAYLVLGGGI